MIEKKTKHMAGDLLILSNDWHVLSHPETMRALTPPPRVESLAERREKERLREVEVSSEWRRIKRVAIAERMIFCAIMLAPTFLFVTWAVIELAKATP